jgi:ABC-type sugar transport system substrate-binding protein
MTKHQPRRARRVTIGIVASLALVAAACGDDDDDDAADTADAAETAAATEPAGTEAPSTAAPTAAPSEGPFEVAHFVAIQANPVEEVIIQTAQATADAAGDVNVTLFDANNDPQAQIAQCEDAIASGKYHGFLLKAVAGQTMIGCAEEAIAAGITVVASGQALGPDSASTDIQVPGVAGSVIHSAITNGNGIVELIEMACADAAADPCEVVYLFGPLTFDWSSKGRDTVHAALDGRDDITIVAEQTQNFSPDEALTAAQQLLPANPGVDVLALDCSFCVAPIIAALPEMGMEGLPIVSAGTDAGTVQEIKDGTHYGSVLLIPATEARLGMQMLIDALHGTPIADNTIDVAKDGTPFADGSIVATAENIGDFTAEWPLGA